MPTRPPREIHRSESPPAEKQPPPARRSRAAKSPAETLATKAPPKAAIDPNERRGMIAVVAYLRAERRGFVTGYEDEDWLAAEVEIDALLSAGHGKPPQ